MEPQIGRSIMEGFRTANHSWAAIGIFALGLMLVTIIAMVGVFSTKPPATLFQRAASEEGAPAVAGTPTIPKSAVQTSGTTVFDQLETTKAPPPQETTAPAASGATAGPTASTPNAQRPSGAQQEEQARAIRQWFGRAWPILVLCVLIALAGNIWLSGGQIGYLAARIKTQQATLSTFWSEGARSFLRLLGGYGLVMVGFGGLAGIIFLLAAVLSVLPGGIRIALGVCAVVGLIVGVVWLMVRFSFWFLAIVADRLGPIAALKASCRATQGRWWRVVGLGALMALISWAVWLPLALLQGLGTMIGGPAALGLGLITNLGGIAASLYVGFAALAAYIRFYQDAKAASGTASGAAQ